MLLTSCRPDGKPCAHSRQPTADLAAWRPVAAAEQRHHKGGRRCASSIAIVHSIGIAQSLPKRRCLPHLRRAATPFRHALPSSPPPTSTMSSWTLAAAQVAAPQAAALRRRQAAAGRRIAVVAGAGFGSSSSKKSSTSSSSKQKVRGVESGWPLAVCEPHTARPLLQAGRSQLNLPPPLPPPPPPRRTLPQQPKLARYLERESAQGTSSPQAEEGWVEMPEWVTPGAAAAGRPVFACRACRTLLPLAPASPLCLPRAARLRSVDVNTTFLSKPIKALILATGRAVCLYKVPRWAAGCGARAAAALLLGSPPPFHLLSRCQYLAPPSSPALLPCPSCVHPCLPHT